MSTQKLENPITVESIIDLLSAILTIVMVISVPIIVFFLIYGGFSYVTARGNPEKIKEASRAIMYGVIGAVIIMGSFAIVQIVKNLVDGFESEETSDGGDN
jgi:TRAP-type C4-dicarboxylate transport system permease small subunit